MEDRFWMGNLATQIPLGRDLWQTALSNSAATGLLSSDGGELQLFATYKRTYLFYFQLLDSTRSADPIFSSKSASQHKF